MKLFPFLSTRRDASVRRKQVVRSVAATFDSLERRTLLAATLSPDGVVLVTGTAGADAIVLRVNGGGADLQVQGAGGLAIFRLSAVRSVRVDAAGGDDVLTIDTAGGLLARADAAMPVRFDGGAGSDTLLIGGAPAGVSVDETLTPGASAGAGKISSVGGGRTQAIEYVSAESIVDTAAAASLTINLGDGGNLVEISNGVAIAGGPSGLIRTFDVTPCHDPQTPTRFVAAAPITAAVTSAGDVASGATSEGDRRNAGKSKRVDKVLTKARAKAAKAAAKVQSILLKQQQGRGGKKVDKAVARATAAAAAAQAAADAAAASAGAAPTPAAPATPTTPPAQPQQALLIGAVHVPVQFANKARITVNTAGGDDWIAVDHAGAARGLTSLTVNAGEGQDHVAAIARPAGATLATPGAEDVSATRGFVGVTGCPHEPEPTPTPDPTPNPEPTPPPAPRPDVDDDDDEGDEDGDHGGNGNGGDDDDDDDGDDDHGGHGHDKEEKDHKDDDDDDDRDDDNDDRDDDDEDDDEDDDD